MDQAAYEILKESSRLRKQNFNEFIDLLSRLAPEQTQFFVIKRENNDILLESIISLGGAGFATFIITRKQNEKGRLRQEQSQLVASPEFTKQLHKARNGDNAIEPIPILGHFKKERLSNPLARVAGIPSFVKRPRQLHQGGYTPLGAFYHDIVYHHGLESANIHRPLWIALAFFFKEKGISFVLPTILDRELPSYYISRSENQMENFWFGIYDMYDRIGREGIPASNFPHTEDYIETVAEFFQKHSLDFGIDLQSLENAIASIEDKYNPTRKLLERIYNKIIEKSTQ